MSKLLLQVNKDVISSENEIEIILYEELSTIMKELSEKKLKFLEMYKKDEDKKIIDVTREISDLQILIHKMDDEFKLSKVRVKIKDDKRLKKDNVVLKKIYLEDSLISKLNGTKFSVKDKLVWHMNVFVEMNKLCPVKNLFYIYDEMQKFLESYKEINQIEQEQMIKEVMRDLLKKENVEANIVDFLTRIY